MLLHRHASAGGRLDVPALDDARPLDRVGRADARRLPDVLVGHELTRIVSSPLRRCLDSVAPLARARGLEIEMSEDLGTDASGEATARLLRELPDTALVCTHREVIGRLFGGAIASEKGGTWILERTRAKLLLPVDYIAPPTTLERERRLAALARSR
jgi:phosphohistidine phosphatase SixA